MPYNTPEKKKLPATGDNYNYVDEMRALAVSIRDIVSVANRAEADNIVTAMQVDGRPVSDANPLYVFNNQTKNIEIRDSSGWRPMVSTPPVGHAGCTNGFQFVANGAVVNLNSAQVLRGGVTFDASTNSLVAPVTGLYRFNLRVLASGGANGYTLNARIRKNTVNTGIYTYVSKPNIYDYTAQTTGILPLAAGDAISLWLDTSDNNAQANTWGTDGYNGTYLEMEMIGV